MLTLWRLGVVPPGDFYHGDPTSAVPFACLHSSNAFQYGWRCVLEYRCLLGEAAPGLLAYPHQMPPVATPRLFIFEQGIWGAVSFWKTDYTTRKPDQEMLGNARRLGQTVTLG